MQANPKIGSMDAVLDKLYGKVGSPEREEFRKEAYSYCVGQIISDARKQEKMTQSELAEKVGISTTHLSHIETGNTKLSLPVFVDIAEALSVQTDELLYDTPSINLSTKAEILNVLDSCSTQDFYILRDIINATKCSLDKYRN